MVNTYIITQEHSTNPVTYGFHLKILRLILIILYLVILGHDNLLIIQS